MLSSLSKIITHSRLSLSLIKQHRSFASTKNESSSGKTSQNDKKNTQAPKIDASHQSGTKSQKERTEWETKEQGLTSDTQTHQERIPQNEKNNSKTKNTKN